MTVAALAGVGLVVGMWVREVWSYAGGRHYLGLFWSATIGGHVPYESRLELDRLWLADFVPSVVALVLSDRRGVGRDAPPQRGLPRTYPHRWLLPLQPRQGSPRRQQAARVARAGTSW